MALMWTALIMVVLLQSSSQPTVGPPAPPGNPSNNRELVLFFGHIGAFAVMTALWWWTFRLTSSHNRALTITVVAVLSIGAATELLQTFVPDRAPSLDDFAVNWLITIATALVIHTRLRPYLSCCA